MAVNPKSLANLEPFKKGPDKRRYPGPMSAEEFYRFDESQRVRYTRWKKYLQASFGADFELMAQLALTPERFDTQTQFAGKEETSVDAEGKQTQSTTGSQQLDPVLKARIDLCKFRLSTMFPLQPKQVQVSGQINHNHLLTQLKSLESKYPEPYIDLETQESGANGSSKPPSTNGSKTSVSLGTQSELTQNKKTELPVSSVTEEASPSSSPVLGQSTLERLKTPE